jgi:fatty-acyl-CoA synthase
MTGFATLADVEAAERVPLRERELPSSTYEMLARAAAQHVDRTALRFFPAAAAYDRPTDLTYGELLEAVHRTANLLHDLGVDGEQVVSLVLPNLPETHFLIWGGEAAGIVNPVNPLLEPEQIAEIMCAAGTRVLATLAPFPGSDLWEKVASILDRVPTLRTVLRVHLADYVPGAERAPAPEIAGVRVLDFRPAMAEHPGDRLASGRSIRPDDPAAYFHTGGTTGAPRLARHTHRNQVFDAWSASLALDVQPGQVFFCGLPLFHVNGVLVTGLIPWSRGGTVVLGTPQGYRGPGVAAAFWKIVEHYGVNFFSGVPTLYSGLLDVPIGDADVGSLRFALCGAAPMPTEVFREFERRTGVRILEGYGLTEGTCVSCVNPLRGDRRVGSVGLRLPYQQVATLVLDREGSYVRECEPGEIGVVATRGPNVFAGYRGGAEHGDAWIDTGDGGGPWLNTGDLGRTDEDGYLWLTGRSKELIIRGGHNIDPQVIEGPLHEHPAVALAAAVGRPDPHAGEVPVAYVQLKPGAEASEDDLLRFLAGCIGERAAVPKGVRIVERIPLTAVGKIFKPQLRWLEAADVYREEVAALGLGGVAAEAGPDPVHGTRVRLKVEAGDVDPDTLLERIRRALGRYTVAYEVEIAG